jgi:hypothetical protein
VTIHDLLRLKDACDSSRALGPTGHPGTAALTRPLRLITEDLRVASDGDITGVHIELAGFGILEVGWVRDEEAPF